MSAAQPARSSRQSLQTLQPAPSCRARPSRFFAVPRALPRTMGAPRSRLGAAAGRPRTMASGGSGPDAPGAPHGARGTKERPRRVAPKLRPAAAAARVGTSTARGGQRSAALLSCGAAAGGMHLPRTRRAPPAARTERGPALISVSSSPRPSLRAPLPPRAPRRARPAESRTALGGGGRGPLCAPGPAPVPQARSRRAAPLPHPLPLPSAPLSFFFFLVYFFPPFPPPPRNARIAQPLPDGAPEGLRGPPPHRSPPARSRGRSPHPPFPSSSPSSFSSSPRPSRRLGLSAPSRRCPIPRPGPAGRSGAGGGHCGAFSPPSSGRHPSRSLLFGWLGPPRRKGRDGGRACAHPAPRSRSPSSALRSQLVPSRPAPPDPPPLPPFLPPPLRPSRSLIEEPGFLT